MMVGICCLCYDIFLGIQLSAVTASSRHSLYVGGEMEFSLLHPLAG